MTDLIASIINKAKVSSAEVLLRTPLLSMAEDSTREGDRCVPSDFTGDIEVFHQKRHDTLVAHRDYVMAYQGIHAHHNPGQFIDIIDEVNLRIASEAKRTELDPALFKDIVGGAKNYLTADGVRQLTVAEYYVIEQAHMALRTKYTAKYGTITNIG